MEGNLSQHSQHSEQPPAAAQFSAPRSPQKGVEGFSQMTSLEAKLHAGEIAKGYLPSHSTTSKSDLTAWINSRITGDLSEVPGIGHANQAHLFSQSAALEKTQGAGIGETVETTHQLIGKYLMLKAPGVSNVDHANLFFQWLKSRGITSHRQAIVQAVAEKTNHMFGGGWYDESEFIEK